MTAEDFIGDKEAAAIFGMAVDTLKHHCMKSHVCRAGSVDVRLACPVVVGRKRRWNRNNIFNLLNGAGLCNGSTRAFDARRVGSIPAPAIK